MMTHYWDHMPRFRIRTLKLSPAEATIKTWPNACLNPTWTSCERDRPGNRTVRQRYLS